MKKSIAAIVAVFAVLCLVILSAGCVGSNGQGTAAAAGDETVIAKYVSDYIPHVQTVQLATSSASGEPNVATMSAIITDNNKIIIGNCFMDKTLANIKENPKVAVLAWNPDEKYCIQFKGTAEIKTDSDKFNAMKELIGKRFGNADLLKNVVVITVTEAYNSMLGENAGQRLA